MSCDLGYKLYRNDGDGGPATRLLGIFPPTARGYNDTNLFADRNFQYVLFATNGDFLPISELQISAGAFRGVHV